MNLPIYFALLSLAFAGTSPESIRTEPKGPATLFLATDGDGPLYFPTDAEPLSETDFAADSDADATVRDLVRREIQA